MMITGMVVMITTLLKVYNLDLGRLILEQHKHAMLI
jgi:hypothetical protein